MGGYSSLPFPILFFMFVGEENIKIIGGVI